MHADTVDITLRNAASDAEGFAVLVANELILLLACVDSVLLGLVMLAIIYVVVHYIIRLQIKGKFVLAFYLLAFLTTTCQIVQACAMIPHWNSTQRPKRHDTTPLNLLYGSESLAKVFNISLGLLIIATMFKIAVSMQLILGELDQEARARKKKNFYIFVSINSLLVCFQIGMVYLSTIALEQWQCSIINAVIYSYILILYCAVMRFLMSKLKRVEAEGDQLQEEKTKIKNQFWIFFLAYLTAASYAIFEALFLEELPTAVFAGKYIVIVFESILPISYVIKVHTSAYSKMAEQARLDKQR